MTKKLLIVEDEILVALELEDIVQSAGFEVVGIAADRAGALRVADDADIALVDLNLRDGATGPSIGEALARDRGVRVIYITANPAQIGAAATTALGVIPKPFSPATVRDAVLIAAQDPPYRLAGIDGFVPLGLAAG